MLSSWLTKPRATVRIDRSVAWPTWMKLLRRPFSPKSEEEQVRIQVLDRLSLGGKKSLVLVSIEGQRLLVGVGEDAAPSISALDAVPPVATPRSLSRMPRTVSGGRRMGRL